MTKTNLEVNLYIHTEILGKCWGRWDGDKYGGAWYRPPCLDCGKEYSEHPEHPDYCSDDSKRSLLNEVVQRIVNQEGLIMEFNHQLCATEGTTIFAREGYPNAFAVAADIIALTAEQIARACVAAWQAK